MWRVAAVVGLGCALVAAGGAAAAVGPASPRGGLVRTAPELPVVGARVTVEVRLPGADVPLSARLDLVTPSGHRMRGPSLRRSAPGVLSGTVTFADDGLWTLRVRGGDVDARTELLVLQNGALVPGPKGRIAVGPGAGGGLGLLGGR